MDVEPQQRIKIEVGIDDLCDILDAASNELRGSILNWQREVNLRVVELMAVIRDLNRQIDAGGVK
jgi:hypothetical protein